jgi:hypothetical protein
VALRKMKIIKRAITGLKIGIIATIVLYPLKLTDFEYFAFFVILASIIDLCFYGNKNKSIN